MIPFLYVEEYRSTTNKAIQHFIKEQGPDPLPMLVRGDRLAFQQTGIAKFKGLAALSGFTDPVRTIADEFTTRMIAAIMEGPEPVVTTSSVSWSSKPIMTGLDALFPLGARDTHGAT
jgi:hypothetical protein